MEQQPYQLVFEGPADNTDETLRKLKATFIAELEYSITEVQEILQNAPVTLQSAGEEDELQNFYQVLKTAGANVLIVRPEQEEELDLTRQHYENDTIDDSDNEDGEPDDDGLVFELEVDDLLGEQKEERKEPKNTTYSLDFNPDESHGDSPGEMQDEVDEEEQLSFESSDALDSRRPEVEQKAQDSEDELSLTFDEADTPRTEAETEQVSVLKEIEEAPAEDLSLSFEEPEQEAEEVSDRDKEIDLSIPEEPLFSFDDQDSESSSSMDADAPLFQEENTTPVAEEQNANLSVPEEPLFSFSEDEDEDKKSVRSVAEPEASLQSESQTSSPLSFVSDEENEGASISPEESQSLMQETIPSQLNSLDNQEVPEDASAVEDQIMDALGSIDQAFEASMDEMEVEEKQDETSVAKITEEERIEPEEPVLQVSESENTLKAPVVQTATSKKQMQLSQVHNPLAIVLLVIIFSASAFLIYLNFLRDPSKNGLTEEAIAKAIQSSALAAKKQALEHKKAQQSSERSAEKLTFRKLQGQSKQSNFDLTWSLTARGTRIISGSMKIETPKPAELTPEEIVRGMQVRPWLRKVDLFSLNFTLKDGTTYTESTQAKAYIEQGDIRRRVAAAAVIELTFDQEKDLIKGDITVRYPEEFEAKNDTLHIQKTKKSYEIYLKHSFEAPAGSKEIEE